ncbi:MAG: hypothetical protein ACI8S6_000989 [Myxococcota bacterium]|jgi:hypothetical protein
MRVSFSILMLLAACDPKDTTEPDTGTDAVDADSDGFAEEDDCDDTDAAINPDAAEVCDGIDNDCDALTDDLDDSVSDQGTFYIDSDGDGFGTSDAVLSCTQPSGTVTIDGDCDDEDAAISPDSVEVCDEADTDEDCSGAADDADAGVDPSTQQVRYADSDEDGFGDELDKGTRYCDPPKGVTEDNTDCDDSTELIYPDAEEVCDGLDNNCDGVSDDGVAGGSTACAAASCLDVLLDGGTSDGLYWLDPDGDGKDAAELYCDQTTDRGGWTLISWTGDSTSTTGYGTPYPGLAICDTQDCLRGSAADTDFLTSLIADSAEIGHGHSTSGSLSSYQNLGDYDYSGYYDYGSLKGFYLDPGTGTTLGCDTTGLATGTFYTLSGPTDYDGTTMYVAQSFRYSTGSTNYNDFDESNLYIWNIGAEGYCAGSGAAPGAWLGNFTTAEYGPYLSSTAGARAIWVR